MFGISVSTFFDKLIWWTLWRWNAIDFLPSLLTTSLDLLSVSLISPLNEYSKEVKPGTELDSFDTTNFEDLLSQFVFSESEMNDNRISLYGLLDSHKILVKHWIFRMIAKLLTGIRTLSNQPLVIKFFNTDAMFNSPTNP